MSALKSWSSVKRYRTVGRCYVSGLFAVKHFDGVGILADRGVTFWPHLRKLLVTMSSNSTKSKVKPKRRKPRPQPKPEVDADRCGDTQSPANDEATTAGGKSKLKSSDVTGLKYFAMLAPLLERLHDDQCQRDKANQRELHYDQYCMLILLYLFNPTVTSLRAIEQASELKKVQKKLGCSRSSLASLSEASRVFDAERLQEIIAELGEQSHSLGRHSKLGGIQQNITLVDGSLVSALPDIMQASLLKATKGSALLKWRLHTHFEVDRYVPTRIDVTPDKGGKDSERAVFEQTLEADRLYVMDRGYAKFSLYNAIVAKQSSYVCRVRDHSQYKVLEEHDLTPADIEAGVLSCQTISLGASSTKASPPDHPVRLICVKCSPHTSRGRRQGRGFSSTAPNSDGILRIVTNLMDVPAEIIALIYSQRWIIEIFFRFFKQMLGCSHLLSHGANGIKIQCYCAIIACLLMNLWTGRKPTKRTFEMLCYYFSGLASEEELLAHLDKLKAKDEAQAAKIQA